MLQDLTVWLQRFWLFLCGWKYWDEPRAKYTEHRIPYLQASSFDLEARTSRKAL